MAKNWTLSEATKAILSGDKEATLDIGRRFPLTAVAIAKMGNNEGALDIIGAIPSHITTRKIESILKDGVNESEDEDVEDDTPDEPVEEKKPTKKTRGKAKKEEVKEKAAEDEDDEYSSMSAMDLFKLCKKRGLNVEPKQKQAVYIKALKADDAAGSEDDEWEEEEEVKKPAKKETKKAPAKKAAKKEEVEEDDDDDWDI